MSPQDIEKLLGGYATDTLNEEERRTLFAAALGNQALFEALADEQALKELLDDPPSRAHLLAALREQRPSLGARIAAWLRQPSALALAAAVAAGIVTVAVVIPHKTTLQKPAAVAINIQPPKDQIALQSQPEAKAEPKPAPPAPSGSPAPAPAERRKEPERDAMMAKDERRAANSVEVQTPPATIPPAPTIAPAAEPGSAANKPAAAAAAPSPAPPPPPVVAVAPAQARFKAAEETQLAQSKLADAAPPAVKKEAAPAGARQLFYGSQAAAGGAAGGLLDRTKSAKTSRESFGRAMTLSRPGAPVSPSIGGVRYSILKRNLDGSFVEVEPLATFVAGDAVRIRFETNQAGNLAVMERQANGQWALRLVTPTKPGAPVYLPAENTINITSPGAIRYFVRFSRSLRADARLDAIAPTPTLLRESEANSVYVVNPAAAADPVVDFELTINTR